MNFLSLFSGIGGFDLGLERAGMNCIGQVEFNPFCQKVLKKHWPDVKLIGDIHDVKGNEFGTVDLICGGFPCQPFSVAGKRKGKEDDRYLWPEMLRVISLYKPSWIIGENVAGIVNLALDQVLSDLESQGYETQCFIIPACAVNAWHRRDRVWIIANRSSERLQKPGPSGIGKFSEEKGEGLYNRLEQQNSDATDPRRIGQTKHEEQTTRIEQCFKDAPDSMHNRLQGSREKRDSEGQARLYSGENGDWEENWIEAATRFCGISHGVSSKLDEVIRRLTNENEYSKNAIKQIDKFRREVLREMWRKEQKIKSSSYRNEIGCCNDSLYNLSHERAYEKWYLGTWIKKEKELCNLWKEICSLPFKETQNMQQSMLKHIREKECNEKMELNRTDRLKALGNAVVPQIVEIIGRYILEAEKQLSHESRKTKTLV